MAEKISSFEMKHFWTLNTLAIYFSISKIRVFIQITIWNAWIQMVPSKNKRFSEEETKNYTLALRKEKKVPVCEMLEFGSFSSSMFSILSWKLKIIAYRNSSTIRPSSKLELLCQCKIIFIVTKSSIIDDLGVRDQPLVCLFSVQNIIKNIKT